MHFVVCERVGRDPPMVVHRPGDVVRCRKAALRDGGSPVLGAPLPDAPAAEAGDVAVEASRVELCLEYRYRPAIPTDQPVQSVVTHRPEEASKLRAVFLPVGRETYAGSARAFAEALRAAFDKGSRP